MSDSKEYHLRRPSYFPDYEQVDKLCRAAHRLSAYGKKMEVAKINIKLLELHKNNMKQRYKIQRAERTIEFLKKHSHL